MNLHVLRSRKTLHLPFTMDILTDELVPLLRTIQLGTPDLLVDGYDQYSRRDSDVVNITPDEGSDGPADTEAEPLANDCEL